MWFRWQLRKKTKGSFLWMIIQIQISPDLGGGGRELLCSNTIQNRRKKNREMEICGSQKSWKANQSHNVEGNHFFLFFSYQVPVTLVVRTHLATLQILKYSWIFSLPHILVIPWIILTKKKDL